MIFDITKIKSARTSLNLTQTQFAKAASVSQSLIAKVESGRLDPSYSIVKKIEEAITRLSLKSEPEAKDIMIKKLISIDGHASAKDAVKLLQKHDISQLPVMEYGKVIGLVSESSILEKTEGKLDGLSAKDVMADAPPIVPQTTKRSVLAALLKQYSCILITKGTDIVGLVTKADLLRAL